MMSADWTRTSGVEIFGVVAKLDDDAAECLLTNALGEVVWWRGDTLFPEEFIPLRYAPMIPRSRLPLPYGSRFGEPA